MLTTLESPLFVFDFLFTSQLKHLRAQIKLNWAHTQALPVAVRRNMKNQSVKTVFVFYFN